MIIFIFILYSLVISVCNYLAATASKYHLYFYREMVKLILRMKCKSLDSFFFSRTFTQFLTQLSYHMILYNTRSNLNIVIQGHFKHRLVLQYQQKCPSCLVVESLLHCVVQLRLYNVYDMPQKPPHLFLRLNYH